MTEYGQIGSAIFAGDFMLSQQGTGSGNYTNFNNGAGSFIPNFYLNFLTGLMHAKMVDIEGTIRSKMMYTKFYELNYSSGYTIDPSVTGANIKCIDTGSGINKILNLPSAVTWNGLIVTISNPAPLTRIAADNVWIKTSNSFWSNAYSSTGYTSGFPNTYKMDFGLIQIISDGRWWHILDCDSTLLATT